MSGNKSCSGHVVTSQELGLNKHPALSKPNAHRGDVSLMLREMLSPLGLWQVLSMPVPLNKAIFFLSQNR